MPFVRAADLVVHYELTGPAGAPVVVFANSLGTCTTMWDDQVAAFARRHRVLRYDKRGHGLTECTAGGDPAAANIAQLGDDLAALLDALSIARVRMVGLSIGGLIGQRFAAQYPHRVEKLVLCATATRHPAAWDERIATVRQKGLASMAHGIMERWFTDDFRASRGDDVRGFITMLTRTPPEGYIAGCVAVRDADMEADDARITAPTLVLSGEQDPGVPPEAGAALTAAIAGARQTVIEGASHIINVERADAFNATVLEFLEA